MGLPYAVTRATRSRSMPRNRPSCRPLAGSTSTCCKWDSGSGWIGRYEYGVDVLWLRCFNFPIQAHLHAAVFVIWLHRELLLDSTARLGVLTLSGFSTHPCHHRPHPRHLASSHRWHWPPLLKPLTTARICGKQVPSAKFSPAHSQQRLSSIPPPRPETQTKGPQSPHQQPILVS